MSNIVDHEQQYLGGIFLMAIREHDLNEIESVANMVKPDEMYVGVHKRIHTAILRRVAERKHIDLVVVSDIIQKQPGANESDFQYLTGMVNNTASTSNLKEYAGIIKSHSVKRQGIALSNRLGEMFLESDEPAKVLGEAETMIQTLMGKASFGQSSFSHISQILGGFVTELEKRLTGDQETMGLTTSMPTIDEYLDGGIQPGSLVVMGGRPGSGKTSMMLSLIKGMAREMQTRSALAFSMEMSKLQLAKRYVSSHTGASYNRMVQELQNDPDQTMWSKIFQLVGDDQSLPIYVADSSRMSVEQVCADVRQHARDNRIGLIAIDYLGLMDMPSADRHDLSIGKVTRALKLLAMELNCVVLLLSQVNRGVEKRDNKRPMASDFANSGAIENDADYIFTLYRDNYYNEDSIMGDIGEVAIPKNRHGEPFKVFMNFTNGNWIDNCDQAQAYNLMTQSTSKPARKPYGGEGI